MEEKEKLDTSKEKSFPFEILDSKGLEAFLETKKPEKVQTPLAEAEKNEN